MELRSKGRALAAPVAGRRSGALRRQEAIHGWLLVSPWVAGLVVFIVGPVVASLYLSLTDYNVLNPPVYVGLKNYVTAFTGDRLFPLAIGRTVYYVVLTVPLGILGSLGLALLLNRGVPGTNLFRTMFFLPSLTPVVASAILWTWILQPQVGLLNYLLHFIGVRGPAWLGNPATALPALSVITLWGSLGGTTMIIFLAGLQGVPQELYDAADIDGAGGWSRFRHVTLPLISPTMFFNLVLGIIASLKVFTTAFIATGGGPAFATWFVALHIWSEAFKYLEMGYASALAWIFTLILVVITVAQLRFSRRWVYYEGEDRA